MDIKFLQDYNFWIDEKSNTILLSIDILNLGNLISSDWGVIEIPVNDQPIGVSFAEDDSLNPLCTI